MSLRRHWLVAALVSVLALATLPGCNSVSSEPKANVIFVLTDDLPWDLVPYMPNVRALQRDGTTFTHYYVTDSLCCPSRASILTGEYPHNHGVHTNNPWHGGFLAFRSHGDEEITFGLAMHRAGYRTGFMGKYLNGYLSPVTAPKDWTYVPPGWDTWDVAGEGYPEYGYVLNTGRHLHYRGNGERDYLTGLLGRRSSRFVRHASSDQPFLLEVATFAPHRPWIPAPRDAHRYPHLQLPRTPAFNHLDKHALKWQRLPALSTREQHRLTEHFRDQVRTALAVDRMIGRLRRQLRARHLDDKTYLVFSSDNGYHIGQHRLRPGKNTAYDSDIRVPLIVVGPSVPAGRKVSALTQSVDLAPTFNQIAGIPSTPMADGRSLLPFLRGGTPKNWRQAALVEHESARPSVFDPDRQSKEAGIPPSYSAIRAADYLYVEYATGAHEYYDTADDPAELHNSYHSLSDRHRTRLHHILEAMTHCRGSSSCFAASRLPS